MDAQEIRMRCLEAAQAAVKTHVPASETLILGYAAKFEAFVVGKAVKARAEKEAAQ